MKTILDELLQVEKAQTLQLLARVADSKKNIQIKILNDTSIITTALKRVTGKNHFYIEDKTKFSKSQAEVTIKLSLGHRLFFLKTTILKSEKEFYFHNVQHFYELVRRKKPRYAIPQEWPQAAIIHGLALQHVLKSPGTVVEMSKTGMKLIIKPELPLYEKNQDVKLTFKIFRRGEVSLRARIIHLKRNRAAGPTVGLQFIETSELLRNKIQNICDDLAFYYASAAHP